MFDSWLQARTVDNVLANYYAHDHGFRIERNGNAVLVFVRGDDRVVAVNKDGYALTMQASEVRGWVYARGALAQLVEQIGPHR